MRGRYTARTCLPIPPDRCTAKIIRWTPVVHRPTLPGRLSLAPDEPVSLTWGPGETGRMLMATYLYHCLACGHDFQRAESMSQHEHTHPACPKCKSAKVEAVLAPFFAKTGRKA